MTSMSGSSDSADQQIADDHRAAGLRLYALAATRPIVTWPRLAIWLRDAEEEIHAGAADGEEGYSARNVCIGSTRAARDAGSRHATIAIISSSAGAVIIVAIS